jgi:putative tricarboxylic transport membrane protein
MRPTGLRQNDLLAAATAVGVGIFALGEASGYEFGRPRQMGPGFFPVLLALLMIGLGIGIAIEGWLRKERDDESAEGINIRGLLAASGAILAFGLLIERVGLIPAIFAAVLIGMIAETNIRIPSTLALAAGLSLFATVVFIHGLALPLRAIVW